MEDCLIDNSFRTRGEGRGQRNIARSSIFADTYTERFLERKSLLKKDTAINSPRFHFARDAEEAKRMPHVFPFPDAHVAFRGYNFGVNDPGPTQIIVQEITERSINSSGTEAGQQTRR